MSEARRPPRTDASSRSVLVGLSGGVDSATATVLLARAGHHPVGLFLSLLPESVEAAGRAFPEHRACCGTDAADDARRVALALDIPFYVLDGREAFERRVIGGFIDGYRRGTTPNPCALCNREVKFTLLARFADALGIHRIATGHYARIDRAPDSTIAIRRARDERKDQSYMLARVPREVLARCLFPVGEVTKDESRRLAREAGFDVWKKPESQDICFIPQGGPIAFLRRSAPDVTVPGDIVDREGRVLGRHEGLPGFTPGQRKGLGLPGGPVTRVVTALDPRTRRVQIGEPGDLARREIALDSVNWIDARSAEGGAIEARVALRYRATPLAARIHPLPDHRARVELLEAGGVAAPGQLAAVYDGERLLGGGIVSREDADSADRLMTTRVGSTVS